MAFDGQVVTGWSSHWIVNVLIRWYFLFPEWYLSQPVILTSVMAQFYSAVFSRLLR